MILIQMREKCHVSDFPGQNLRLVNEIRFLHNTKIKRDLHENVSNLGYTGSIYPIITCFFKIAKKTYMYTHMRFCLFMQDQPIKKLIACTTTQNPHIHTRKKWRPRLQWTKLYLLARRCFASNARNTFLRTIL